MKNRIITISREFGSGGRTIGRRVAEELGIPCYDQEILNELLKSTDLTEDVIREDSEYIRKTWFSGYTAGLTTPADDLWFAQKKLIEELAMKGNCVIVGRCADYILEDQQDCLRVFIHASYAFREDRIKRVYGETDVPTMKRLKQKDKSRKAYYLHYTDIEWGDLRNYDVMLNSGALGIDKCVETIKALY